MFGHEKFGAYNLAIDFVALSAPIIEAARRGNFDLVDQLKRATISIPLNITEGSGKNTERDKKRFYSIARGSAMECAAIFDVLVCLELVDNDSVSKPKAMLSEITAILSSVCLRE
jgi:four helix bundle protein